MPRDLAALLETQADIRDTAPSTTIVPRPLGVEQALGLLEQMAGSSLLASIQLKTGAVIGQGGMGIVREAEQVALGRTVAVKTVKPDKRSPEAAQDLLREAWVTGSLEHPNVVPVHHLGLDADGLPAIVLKRVEGVEWSKLIRDAAEVKRRYATADLLAWNLSILMQVLNAIRFAHSRGILHRDLKPANVMVGDFGEVYLLDWGVAVSTRDTTGRLPSVNEATYIAGTPCYMAPEMLQPDGDVPLSERTDVYLAGSVLFEIIAGRPPHEGKTALEVMTSVMSSKPKLPDDVPGELGAICQKAMASDPSERYETAEAVRHALQSYVEHRGSDQIVTRAKARLDELAAVLATPPHDRLRHREEVYRLFGACRFGFHEALAAWHDNTAAKTGLRRATVAVAEYELATGDAHSAVTLLGELDDPPASLLEKARAAAAQHADRQQALEELDYAHDLAVGRLDRGKLATTIGVFFVLAPLFLATPWGAAFEHHATHIGWSVLFVLVVSIWTWLGRSRLTTTLVNRRLLGALTFMFVAQALAVACLWRLGVSIAYTQLMMLFLYFVSAGIGAITVDRALRPSAIGFGLAFVIATFHIEYRYWVLAVADAIFTINSYFAWRRPLKR